MENKLNQVALANAAAVVSAFLMLVLGILGNLGVYTGAAEMMREWHMFFSFSIFGIIAGMIEAAIISFIFFYLFAWVYNIFTGKHRRV